MASEVDTNGRQLFRWSVVRTIIETGWNALVPRKAR
jgi:hypothetical protein